MFYCFISFSFSVFLFVYTVSHSYSLLFKMRFFMHNYMAKYGKLAEEASLLLDLPGANDLLELTKVDVLDYGSLADLFQGCNGVFYVPDPYYNINGIRDYPVSNSKFIIVMNLPFPSHPHFCHRSCPLPLLCYHFHLLLLLRYLYEFISNCRWRQSIMK